MIVIGSAISFNTAVAAVVTVPVAFCVLFSGIVGPNAASGAVAALVAYVLPATSPGLLSASSRTDWPDGGWHRCSGPWPYWCSRPGRRATGYGPPPPIRPAPWPTSSGPRSARECTDADGEAALAAKHALMNAFASTPYRPTGLALSDQALANLVESLEWCTTLVTETLREGTDLRHCGRGRPSAVRRVRLGSSRRRRPVGRRRRPPRLVDNLRDLERTVAEAGAAISMIKARTKKRPSTPLSTPASSPPPSQLCR